MAREPILKDGNEFFQQFLEQSERLSANALASFVADHAGVNAQLAKFLADSRTLVEHEVLLTMDAMQAAFDDKSGKLDKLQHASEGIVAQVAFMKTSLNSVKAKCDEVDALTKSIDVLLSRLNAFKSFVDDGTMDRVAKAAAAMRG
jgi:hypothetical protein